MLNPLVTNFVICSPFQRRNARAIFVKKHNLPYNLEAVENETKLVASVNAQDWLFLVEGYRRYSSVENTYLESFVDLFNIEAEDPIAKPFTSEVARAAYVENVLAALSVLVMDYLDFLTDNRIDRLGANEFKNAFDDGLNQIAKAFDVSPKLLRREFNKLKWNNEEKLAKQLLFLSEKRRQLIAESNSQSRTRLIDILSKNNSPNLFIMSGIEHAPVFIAKGN